MAQFPHGQLVGGLMLFVSATGADAQVGGRFSADLRLGSGYSSRPFPIASETGGSGFADLGLVTRYSLDRDLTKTLFEGRFNRRRYTQDYGSSDALNASLRHEERLTERLDVTASAAFDSSIVGEADLLTSGPPVPAPDSGLGITPPAELELPLSGKQRRRAFRTDATVTLINSQVDAVSVGAGTARTSFGDATASTRFWAHTGLIGYNRAFDERTMVGGRAVFQFIRYDAGEGTYKIFQPEIRGERKLHERLTLTGSVGALLISSRIDGRTENSQGLSGSLRGCYRDDRSGLCFGFLRDASGTGRGGVRKRSSLDMSYSYRLAEESTVRLSAVYGKFSATTGESDEARLFNSSATFDQRIMNRLSASATLSYRVNSGLVETRDASIFASLVYRLGSLR